MADDRQGGPHGRGIHRRGVLREVCKEKRNFTGHVEEKNSRRFAKGICPECGTKVARILGKA